MKHFRIIQLFGLLLLLTTNAWAQPMSEWVNAADKAFEKGDYYSAKEYYNVALKYDSTRMDLWYKMGESAQFHTAFNVAQQAYEKVSSSSMRDSFPLLDFRKAQVLQHKGHYRAAASLFQEFLSKDLAVASEILDEAERNRINSEWASDMVNRPVETTVRHLGQQVNSPYSDFAPYYKNDTLYFSSLRYQIKKDTVLPRRSLSRILLQPSQDVDASKLDSKINEDNNIVAHTAFDHKGETVYFTLCDYKKGSIEFKCDIYCAAVDSKGQWGAPKRLPVNDAVATTTHPSIGRDPFTGHEYLYFSSDRSGGKGGMDLYKTQLLGAGLCGAVEPLDELNTEGNDISPFFYSPTQVLYFSTDGRLTFGGYDIYRSNFNGRGWDRPTNMGSPVNSSYNDMDYSRFTQKKLAYFASNRPDSLAIFWDDTKDACCNDIYSVGITDEIELLVLNFNALDQSELPLSSVALYELRPEGKVLIDSVYNPRTNDFNFLIVPGKKYEVVGTRPGFTTDRDTVDLSSEELVVTKKIERKLYLSPDLELDVFTFNKRDRSELEGTTVYLYEITPDGKMILMDSIINPLANDYHFKLKRGKQYQVFARKDGFVPDMTYIDTNAPEFATVNKIRKDLYLEPGLALEVYTWRMLDSTALTRSTVYLYEYTDLEGETLIDSTTNLYGNQFGFLVEKGKRYVIRGERDGYGPATTSLDLSGPEVPETGTYRKDLYLGQLLEIFTFDSETEEPLPGAHVKLIDPVTGNIIAEKINPESNDFYFSVTLERPYRLEVTRKGYKPVMETLIFTEEELKEGGGKLTVDVFLEPYTDPNSMLPLILYYDNDHPNPRSTSPTTDLEYVATNVEYFQKRQEFIQNFTEGMELEEAYLTRRRFNDFFNLEVRGGRYDLEEFAKRLLKYLQEGNTFTMDLKGFASPRATTLYNQILSQRRIVAVKNFFERYENGVFIPYITAGALTYEELPVGETLADPRVTADLNDTKNSIYNVFASLERRVEIHSAKKANEN